MFIPSVLRTDISRPFRLNIIQKMSNVIVWVIIKIVVLS
jgi:hypothetical protein